jgi:type II secretion system protein I
MKQRSAFTLIEALIAIALIAVVLPVVMSAVNAALRGVERSRTQEISRRVANSRLARLVADNSWSSTSTSGTCTAEDDGEDALGYVWQLNVARWHDATIHELTLRVGRGTPEAPGSVALTTLVSEATVLP